MWKPILVMILAIAAVAMRSFIFKDTDLDPLGSFYDVKVGLKPIQTPENAVFELKQLLDSATKTIDIQLQYIRKYNSREDWLSDGNPLMQSLVMAMARLVKIRVILEPSSDKHKAAQFLRSVGIPVRYMRSDIYNHNKAIIVDGVTISISSINWSHHGLEKNAEVGVILYDSPKIVNFYKGIFDMDWKHGTEVWGKMPKHASHPTSLGKELPAPRAPAPMFNVTLDVTAFVNPGVGVAFNLVTSYLAAAKRSIHVAMYSVSLGALVEVMENVAKHGSVSDVSVVLSHTQYSAHEASQSKDKSNRMLMSKMNVYDYGDDSSVLHSKLWIIDGTHVFIHTGNWATTSLTPLGFTKMNRDFGIAFHDRCLAYWFEKNVFRNYINRATQRMPAKCLARSFDECMVCGHSSDCEPQLLEFNAKGICRSAVRTR